MNEDIIRGLMITVVYPAMIVTVAGLFAILQGKLQKYNRPSKKSVPHRIRK